MTRLTRQDLDRFFLKTPALIILQYNIFDLNIGKVLSVLIPLRPDYAINKVHEKIYCIE